MKHALKFALCAALFCNVVTTRAATVWDESVNGDLSGDRLAPTPLLMAAGSNAVFGTVGNGGSGIDRDYFVFSVPTGGVLASITLLSASVSGGASFFAIEAGPQILSTPTGVGVENLLGFTHYGNDQVGTDLLPSILIGATPPLSAGTYSVWVQETGGPASYGLDFVINAVPEPETYALILGGLGLLGLMKRQRKSRA